MSEAFPPQAEPLHRAAPPLGAAADPEPARLPYTEVVQQHATQSDQDTGGRDRMRSGMAQLCARHRPPLGSGPATSEGRVSAAPAVFVLHTGGTP